MHEESACRRVETTDGPTRLGGARRDEAPRRAGQNSPRPFDGRHNNAVRMPRLCRLAHGRATEGVGLLRDRGFQGWLMFEHEKRRSGYLEEPGDSFPQFASWVQPLVT